MPFLLEASATSASRVADACHFTIAAALGINLRHMITAAAASKRPVAITFGIRLWPPLQCRLCNHLRRTIESTRLLVRYQRVAVKKCASACICKPKQSQTKPFSPKTACKPHLGCLFRTTATLISHKRTHSRDFWQQLTDSLLIMAGKPLSRPRSGSMPQAHRRDDRNFLRQ